MVTWAVVGRELWGWLRGRAHFLENAEKSGLARRLEGMERRRARSLGNVKKERGLAGDRIGLNEGR